MARMVHIVVAVAPVVAAGAVETLASLWDLSPASACSIFDRHPCTLTAPTGCSVFHRRPCIPDILPPIGEDLRLTIETPAAAPAPGTPAPNTPAPSAPSPSSPVPGEVATTAQAHHDGDPKRGEQKVETIRDLFDLLRTCWAAPSLNEARPGMQMTVRFSFKRDGELIGTPRMTFVTPDASSKERDTYRRAIDAALDRCTPIPFSNGMGGAIAGRPIAVRFVDNRGKS
jgi:hypothetical protein